MKGEKGNMAVLNAHGYENLRVFLMIRQCQMIPNDKPKLLLLATSKEQTIYLCEYAKSIKFYILSLAKFSSLTGSEH